MCGDARQACLPWMQMLREEAPKCCCASASSELVVSWQTPSVGTTLMAVHLLASMLYSWYLVAVVAAA